jgi:hypothetical protein
MTADIKTVLTDEAILDAAVQARLVWQNGDEYPTPYREDVCIRSEAIRFARAIERAVLSAIDSERKDDSRDARRYREARQHPYLYGIGNPEPWQFDAYIDAALEISASKSSEVKS